MLRTACLLAHSWRSPSRLAIHCHRNLAILNTKGSTASVPTEFHHMEQDYDQMCKRCNERVAEMEQIDPRGVFVNNEVRLGQLEIFGFDFDHTLATYTQALNEFIFDEARNWLVKQMKYPEQLMDFTYAADFAIRGLHFDVQRGYLMKVDSFHNIQLDTVHRGLTPVRSEESLQAYQGNHLPGTCLKQSSFNIFGHLAQSISKSPSMFQLMDVFTLPEFYLLCCIIEYFDRNHFNYQPIYVYQDVSNSVARVHKSGLLGLTIMGNPEKYIKPDPHLAGFLHQLVSNGRKLFVISNSSASFIDRGLRFLIGDDWRLLFDVIISSAKKPRFFQHDTRPFRHMDDCGGFKDWEPVKELHKSHIYEGGSLSELIKLTRWNAQNILYFGDHVYSDLADVANLQGWTTAAVIPELEHEIKVNNKVELHKCWVKVRGLEHLIDKHQHAQSPQAITLLDSWHAERDKLRHQSKVSFNQHFGSIFRSFHNPSYFSRRLSQYAILYTSKVTNLSQYPLNHFFYPKRSALPHESS